MKMLRIAAGLALSACFVVFAGCANAPVKLIPPQQLVMAFCPIVNADLDVLSKSPLLTADQRALLADKIIPGNQAVCTAGGQINVQDLQTFNATLFPALITLVASVPTLPNQPTILLGLELAQPILSQVVATVQAQQAASAPAAASTPLAGAPIK